MMFAIQLSSRIIPVVHPSDTVQVALTLMQENHVTQLPVVDEEKFLGLIDEDSLLDAADENQPVSGYPRMFMPVAVSETAHLYQVLKLANEHALSVIPVLKENKDFAGSIPLPGLVHAVADMLGVKEPGAVIVLETEPGNFSPGEMHRLVETNDAMVMQMNTSTETGNGKMIVTLKINKPDISDVVATFQRYEYNVIYYQGEEHYENELKSNYDNLINFLNI